MKSCCIQWIKNSSKLIPDASACWIWQVRCVLLWTYCQHAGTSQRLESASYHLCKSAPGCDQITWFTDYVCKGNKDRLGLTGVFMLDSTAPEIILSVSLLLALLLGSRKTGTEQGQVEYNQTQHSLHHDPSHWRDSKFSDIQVSQTT